jgi:hypothetical protein
MEAVAHAKITLLFGRSTMVLNRTVGYASSPGYSATVLRVNTVLRRLRGGSQSVLVRASDGYVYWVKMLAGYQGPNVLANEVLGNELARYLGISVPDWSPIEFSKDCIEANPLCWPELGSGLPRPSPGMYFATRASGQDECEAAYEILPGNWLNKISNRDDFAGMLALDVWTNQVGSRKAIFVPSPDRSLITAVFIENSQMFGGFWGSEEQSRGAALYSDPRVYANSDLEQACDRWLQKIAAIDESVLRRLARFIPQEWTVPNYLEQTISKLRTRRRNLQQLLARELALIGETGMQSASPILAEDRLGEMSVSQILEGWKPENRFRERRGRRPGRRSSDRNLY